MSRARACANVSGPRESNSVARFREASDHPSAGPIAKTICWAPAPRCRASQAANVSESICRPLLSRRTVITGVRRFWRSTQVKRASSFRNASVRQAAKPEQRSRYVETRPSIESFEVGRDPMCARVSCMKRRYITHRGRRISIYVASRFRKASRQLQEFAAFPRREFWMPDPPALQLDCRLEITGVCIFLDR